MAKHQALCDLRAWWSGRHSELSDGRALALVCSCGEGVGGVIWALALSGRMLCCVANVGNEGAANLRTLYYLERRGMNGAVLTATPGMEIYS